MYQSERVLQFTKVMSVMSSSFLSEYIGSLYGPSWLHFICEQLSVCCFLAEESFFQTKLPKSQNLAKTSTVLSFRNSGKRRKPGLENYLFHFLRSFFTHLVHGRTVEAILLAKLLLHK